MPKFLCPWMTFVTDFGKLEPPSEALIVDMLPIPLGKAGGLVPQSDTPRIVDTESTRQTPFEHEITAEPTEFHSAGTVEASFAGVWTVRTGSVARIPALPQWMMASRKKT
jgi:hypothetical protein